MFSTLTTIEIVGFIISLLVGFFPLLRSFRSRDDAATYYRTLALVLTALGILLTIMISIRYEYLDEFALIRDEDNLKTVELLKKSKSKIKSKNIHLFQEVFAERERAFNQTLGGVSNDELILDIEELGRHAVKLFQHESNITILATSYVKPSDWWKTAWGREYLQENFNAVSRGVNIERIYIFEDQKELNDNKELLDLQKANKITIRYVYEKDISKLAIKDDVIIIGDKLCGTLSLKGRTMIQAVFSVNPDRIASNKGKFSELRKISTEY